LGSHDTERIWNVLRGNIPLIKLAILLQFSFPGAPAIYYGDEIGLQGSKDPDCRRTFNWNQESWNFEIYHWMKKMISLRLNESVLRTGDFKILTLSSKCIWGFMREDAENRILIIFNPSDETVSDTIFFQSPLFSDGMVFQSMLTSKVYLISENKTFVTLNPYEGDLLAQVKKG